VKYAKARASKQTLDKKEQEGVGAMRTYLQTDSAKAINNLQAYVLVFRKDKCVRKIRCSDHRCDCCFHADKAANFELNDKKQTLLCFT
jgi:hypothetical protein